MSVATQIERLQGVRNQIRNKMVSLGLSAETDLLQDLADSLDGIVARGDASATLSTSTRSKTLAAGYYTGGTISVPSNYYPLTSSNTTATAGTVLSGYKFVNTSGGTVTGTIATATSDNVSGSIVAPNPAKITLNTDSTTGSKSATASASVSVAKGLYTGSSDISKALANKTYTANAEVTLASSVAGSTTIPSALSTGTVEVAPTTTRTLYSDTSTTKGYLKSFVVSGIQTETKTVTPATTAQTITPTAGKFISSVAVNPMPSGAYSASVNTHNITNAKASSSVSGTITGITTTTAPTSGTDGTDYYTITPSLSKTDGKSETTAKATVGTSGYIAAGNTTSGTSSKTVGVTTSQGGNRYLNIITPTNAGTTDPGTGYTNVATIGRNTSNQFIKIDKGYNNAARKFTISGVSNGAYSASVSGHVITPATAESSVTGTITNIATSTAPTSGTDGTNYYTIIPSLNTTNGASAATAKATIDTSGYIAANNKTASDTKEVGVTSSQGKSYYINATTPANVGTSDPGNGYTNVATIGRNTNNQFIKIDKGYNNTARKFTISGVPNGVYSTTIPSHIVSESTVGSAVSGSITDIATTTQPSGTDKTDYYTITPAIPTVTAGTSSASAKTTISTAGYISTGTETNDTKPVPIKTSPGSSYYLKTSSFGEVVGKDPNTNLAAIRTVTPSADSKQYILIPAGYTPIRKIEVGKIPSPYYNTNGVTATADTTLLGYKFVNASGATITGTIPTATDKNILASGSIGISPNSTITLNTDKTSDSKTVTATGAVSVAQGFYTGSSNISKTLENKNSKVTANVNLASSVTASDTIPTTGSGIVKVSPSVDSKAYSDTSTTKGFIKTFIVDAMPAGDYSPSVSKLEVSIQPKATPSVTGSIVDIAVTTQPSGTDKTNYYTITPKVTTKNGTATATAKATISTSGYIAAGSDTASDIKDIVVDTSSTVTPYYLKASTFGSETTTNPNTTVLKSVTAGTSTKYIPVNAGYIKSGNITVNPTPSQSKSATPSTSTQTISPDSGKLLSSVSISAIQTETKSVTPTTSAQTVTPTTGKFITSVAVGAIPNQKNADNVSASVATSISNASINATHKTKGLTVTASSSGSMSVPLGYYSSTVSKTPSSSKSATITPVLAGTNADGAITITAGTSASTVTSEDNYNNGFITSVTVNPTPSETGSATPTTSAQTIKPDSGKLLSSVTVDAIPNQKDADSVTATVTASIISDITSINASQVTDGVTVTASASGSTVVPVGYYSTKVSKTPSDSASTTIKPTLAGTNGAIELTAGTSTFTKTSTANYSNGFITSVKVNPTPSQSKSASPSTSAQTISPDSGKLLSSVAISAIPTETKTIIAGTSASTTSATSGKFITSVTVNPTPSQSKSVTPTIAEQTISPDSGKLLSSVTVKAVPRLLVTLGPNNWISDGNTIIGEYYYKVSYAGFTANSNLYVMPESDSISVAQSFGVYAYSQSNNSIEFRAVTKPTSILQYTIYYLS